MCLTVGFLIELIEGFHRFYELFNACLINDLCCTDADEFYFTFQSNKPLVFSTYFGRFPGFLPISLSVQMAVALKFLARPFRAGGVQRGPP